MAWLPNTARVQPYLVFRSPGMSLYCTATALLLLSMHDRGGGWWDFTRSYPGTCFGVAPAPCTCMFDQTRPDYEQVLYFHILLHEYHLLIPYQLWVLVFLIHLTINKDYGDGIVGWILFFMLENQVTSSVCYGSEIALEFLRTYILNNICK